MFISVRISLVTVTMALFCAANAYSQIRTARDPETQNVLSITKSDPDPKLKIEPVPGETRTSLVSNKAKTRTAYVLCVPVTNNPKQCDSLVFVKDVVNQTVYAITGEPGGFERYRLVNDLKWVNKDVLSFERWTGPHFGHRYVVNMKSKKQTGAFIVTDKP